MAGSSYWWLTTSRWWLYLAPRRESSTPTLGCISVFLFLWHPLQVHTGPWKCRLVISTTTARSVISCSISRSQYFQYCSDGSTTSYCLTNRQSNSKRYLVEKGVAVTNQGWPTNIPTQLKLFECKKNELTLEGNCLLWGIRVIIPPERQPRVLKQLHENHPGISVLLGVMYGGPISTKILKNKQRVAFLVRATKTIHHQLHCISGSGRPDHGIVFMSTSQDHSSERYSSSLSMPIPSGQTCTRCQRLLLAAHGLPLQLVSDNGPQFISTEFTNFLKANGVKHVKCTPYHPVSNGQVERFVKTFKQSLKASEHDKTPLKQRLANFLLEHRSTPTQQPTKHQQLSF